MLQRAFVFLISLLAFAILLENSNSFVKSEPCVDYLNAIEVTEGTSTIPDTTCTANPNPFPTSLNLEEGTIVTDNLQIFHLSQQPTTPIYELTVDTCGSNYDTTMLIFVHNVMNQTYDFLAFNDDYCNLQSGLNVAISNEQEVYIAVGGYDALTTGELTLNIKMNIRGASPVDQIRFLSIDIEELAVEIAALANIISSATISSYDDLLLAISDMKAEILAEYQTNGLVSDMTAYTTALQATLDRLKVDATTLQVEIAQRVTADTTEYTEAMNNIETTINNLLLQSGNITNLLTAAQIHATNIDSHILYVKNALSPEITKFMILNTQISNIYAAIEDDDFVAFVCRFLAMSSTSKVPPILMSPAIFNGKIEQVGDLMSKFVSVFPYDHHPPCTSYMKLYYNNYSNGNYVTAFSYLQMAYQSLS